MQVARVLMRRCGVLYNAKLTDENGESTRSAAFQIRMTPHRRARCGFRAP